MTTNYLDEFPVPVKRPLVALLMAEQFKEDLKLGIKTITIREGLRDYKCGDKVVLCCLDSEWAMMAHVTQVKHCSLKEVPIEDLNADGMADLTDAIDSLSRFYEGINEDSLVTVVHWRL